jgi:cellulose biosynthesis protein BcsQ
MENITHDEEIAVGSIMSTMLDAEDNSVPLSVIRMDNISEECEIMSSDFTSKSFGFFAHKGGVGKSTLLFQTCGYLKENHPDIPIIVLDFDPQMNTSFRMIQDTGINVNNNLINRLLETDTGKVFIGDNLIKTSLYYFFNDEPIEFIEHNGISYLIGSPKVDQLESMFNQAINERIRSMISTTRTNIEIFKTIINKIKENYPKVFILVDMPPGITTMNKLILMSIDYFILPLNKDYYSLIGLKLLKNYLPIWRREFDFLDPKIKILCCIFNKYKRYSDETQLNMTKEDYAFYKQFRKEVSSIPVDYFVNNNRLFIVQDMMLPGTISNRDYDTIYNVKVPGHEEKIEYIINEINKIGEHLVRSCI